MLVSNKEISLKETFIPLGEVYARLARFLYRNYCVRRNIPAFENWKFIDSLKRIGKVAWKMLKAGRGYAKQDDIVKEVGDDAYHYGLLIGHKGFELSRHEMADILITFPHETLKEFLGSVGFLQMLDDGEHIDSLLVNETDRSILMESRFFLRFCLWLLSDSCRKEYFEFKNRERVYDSLVSYVAEQINIAQLDMNDMAQIFPILHVPLIHNEENTPLLEFIRRVLAKCDQVKEFYFSSFSFYPIDILRKVVTSFPPHGNNDEGKNFLILDSAENYVPLRKILHAFEDEGISVSLLLANGIQTDLSDCMHSCVRRLDLYDTTEYPSVLNMSKETPMCPLLMRLSLVNVMFNEGVLTTLDRAVQKGFLPALTYLSFESCQSSLTGKLSKLFRSVWPTLTDLDLTLCILSKDDIETLTFCLAALEDRKLPQLTNVTLDVVDPERKGTLTPALKNMFHEAFKNIKGFTMHRASNEDFQNVISAANQGMLPNLTHLSVSVEKHQIKIPAKRTMWSYVSSSSSKVLVQSELTSLILHGFIVSTSQLHAAAKSVKQSHVKQFDISGSTGISGQLSVLFGYNFDSLKDLVLCNCGLNEEDLKNLALASSQEKLPEVKYLDISENPKTVGHLHCFVAYNQKWEKLLILNATQDVESSEDFQFLLDRVRSGALKNLMQLGLSANKHGYPPIGIKFKWLNLQALDTYCTCRNGPSDHVRLFQQILDAAEEDRYPSLKHLRVHSVALPNCSDSKSQIRTLQGLEKASALRQYFREVTQTSSSLLTSCEDNNAAHLLSAYSLVTLKKIVGETPKDYSIFVRAVVKILLLISSSGTLPDFRTIRGVLHECIGNGPDQFKSHHPSLKALADAMCTYLSLFFTGQPRDSSQILNALIDLVDSYFIISD